MAGLVRCRVRRTERPGLRPPTVPAGGAGHQRLELTPDTSILAPPTGTTAYRTARWSTRIDLLVTERSVLRRAVDLLDRELDVVEAVASRFRPDSELSILTDALGSADAALPVPVSPVLAEAVAVRLRAGSLTGARSTSRGGRTGAPRLRPRLLPSWPKKWRGDPPSRSRSRLAVGHPSTVGAGDRRPAPGGRDRPRAHGQGVGRRPVRPGPSPGELSCGVLVSLGGRHRRPRVGTGRWLHRRRSPTSAAADEADVAVTVTDGGLATSGVGRRTLDARWSPGPTTSSIPSTGLPDGSAVADRLGRRRNLRGRQHGVDPQPWSWAEAASTRG